MSLTVPLQHGSRCPAVGQITDLNGHNGICGPRTRIGIPLRRCAGPGWTESVQNLAHRGTFTGRQNLGCLAIHRCHPAQRTPHSRNFPPLSQRGILDPSGGCHTIASTARSIALGAIPLYSPLAEAVIRGLGRLGINWAEKPL